METSYIDINLLAYGSNELRKKTSKNKTNNDNYKIKTFKQRIIHTHSNYFVATEIFMLVHSGQSILRTNFNGCCSSSDVIYMMSSLWSESNGIRKQQR